MIKPWNLLAVNESLKDNFRRITAFQQNENLKEFIGSNEIEKKKTETKK